MARLIITTGDEAPVELQEDRFVIGRAASCSLVIQDDASSRKHCELERTAKGWRITDLDSSNGTTVNGTKIERAPLTPGDVIGIGKTKFRFEDEPEEEASASGSEEASFAEIELDLGEEEIELSGAGDESSGFVLLVTAGQLKDREFPLRGGGNRIGRTNKNDVAFPDPGVSGVHAEVSVEGGQVTVRDLGSTNGTLVNGERLSQQKILAHGDAIQVGVVRLMFVDEARRATEGLSEFDFGDDADEGLEISTLDVERTGSRRGSFALLLLVLILLGGGGYFAYSYLPTLSSEAAPLAVPPENSLLTKGWSFEEGDDLDLWMVGGASARSRVRSERAVSGVSCLVLSPRGEGDLARTDGVLTDDLSVSSLNAYRVSGHVAVKGTGIGFLKVEWWAKVGSEESFLGEIYGNPVSEGSGFEETSFVAVTPTGATHARVGCVALGEGAVCSFDDVAAFKMDRAEGEISRDGPSEHRLTLSDRGVFRLDKGSKVYFTEGEFIAIREDEDGGARRQRQSVYFQCDESPAAGTQGEIRYSGSIVDPWAGALAASQSAIAESSAFRLSYRVAADRVRELGLGFEVEEDYLQTGLKIVTEAGVIEVSGREGEEDVDHAGVRSLIFGSESERMRLAVETPARVSVRRGEGAFLLTLVAESDQVSDGRDLVFDATLQTSFVEERERAVKMCGDGEKLEEDGRLGEALVAFEEVLRELPFNESALARAAAGQERIRIRAAETLRTLETARSDAEVLGQRDLFEQLIASSERAAQVYRDSPYGEEAARISEAAKQGLENVMKPLHRSEARRLFSTGKDLLDAGQERLARAFLVKLVDRYDGSEEAEEAQIDPRVRTLLEKHNGGSD